MKKITLISMLFLSAAVYAQKAEILRETDTQSLQERAAELREEHSRLYRESRQFALENDIPIELTSGDGERMVLQYIDESGRPVYFKLHNSDAAATTSTNMVLPGGSSGLDLTGEGVIVGVWDGGWSRDTHVEFGDRVFNKVGSDLSDHGTHVMGTILAAGVNDAAMGMAPEATGWAYDALGNYSSHWGTIATEASLGDILISNHSYGTVAGWEISNGNWRWYGDDGDDEDWVFGSYQGNAQEIDRILHDAPYYTIVWSAGNDRNDVGDGTHPADGPYDCLGPEAVAKNSIVVGAVNALDGPYSGPSDVVMSSFSSWGPTDDGRIKPDIVGMGVSVLSTSSSGDEAYTVKSGTSMSAPNVTGSLTLLQQLSNRKNGTYLKSATLKALMIHTAREAGNTPGPDYKHGWGLMNTRAAAELLDQADDVEKIVRELSLTNEGTYEYSFYAKRDAKITATIAWTDPEGTRSASNTVDDPKIILVNDLDLRIVDEAGNEQLPWILDPANEASAASRGDNFRDNVEKIEFDNPEPRLYTIRVTHKESLKNFEPQDFSLVVTMQTEEAPASALYWIGGNGDWEDPNHWSLTSGGPAAGVIPDAATTVIVDENSFAAEDELISVNSDVEVNAIRWLSKSSSTIDLGGNQVTIASDLEISSDRLTVDKQGTLVFSSASPVTEVINLGRRDLSGVNVMVDGEGSVWTFSDSARVNKITVLGGEAKLQGTAHVDSLLTLGDGAKSLNVSATQLVNPVYISVAGLNSTFKTLGASIDLEASTGQTRMEISDQLVEASIIVGNEAELEISGANNSFSNLMNAGTLTFLDDNDLVKLEMLPGSSLEVAEGKVLDMTTDITATGEEGNPVNIRSTGSASAYLGFEGHVKLCFDYLNISSVTINGEEAAINAGENSSFSGNSFNWQSVACGEVLFADFETEFNCVNSVTKFMDTSSGNISSWQWEFDLTGTPETVTDSIPEYSFSSPGEYEVKLTISDGGGSNSVIRTINVIENTLPVVTVFMNSQDQLVSTVDGDTFQWYVDGEPIEGANERSYIPGMSGPDRVFEVLVSDATCNRFSDQFLVTALEEELEETQESEVRIYPNPFDGTLSVDLHKEAGYYRLRLHDIQGILRFQKDIYNSGNGYSRQFDLNHLAKGIYIMTVESDVGVTYRARLIRE